MKISTKVFGEIEISKERIITFNYGLPGFEDLKEFILLDLEDTPSFKCLQSIKEKEVAFFVTQPWDFFLEYEVDLPQKELDELSIKNREEVSILNVITIPDEYEKATANLLAPLVISVSKMIGKQIVLHDSSYETKHYLFNNEKEGDGHACTG